MASAINLKSEECHHGLKRPWWCFFCETPIKITLKMPRLNRRIFFEFFCLDGNYSPKNEQIYERLFLTVRKEVIEIKEKNHVMTYFQSRRARKLVHQCCNYESRNSLPLTMEKHACVYKAFPTLSCTTGFVPLSCLWMNLWRLLCFIGKNLNGALYATNSF